MHFLTLSNAVDLCKMTLNQKRVRKKGLHLAIEVHYFFFRTSFFVVATIPCGRYGGWPRGRSHLLNIEEIFFSMMVD
jgi:hypothetical protein